MKIENSTDYDKKLVILQTLLDMREGEDLDLDQKYLTLGSILKRVEVLIDAEAIDRRRILAFGDADFTALATSIFGNPSEVVIVDIDRRLTDILFEANMEFDLSVRFVYHDLRIKIIEILRNQYSTIIMEPPHTKAGIEVYISRALQCIQADFEENIFISVPAEGYLNEYFQKYLKTNNIVILETHDINDYQSIYPKTLFYRMRGPIEKTPTVPRHWILPFYTYEENAELHEYRCICHEIINVGADEQFTTLQELQEVGHSCGHKGVFAFRSNVKLL